MSISDAYKPNLKRAGKLFGEAMGTVMSIPANMRRMRSEADATALKRMNAVPKNVPRMDMSGNVTEGYKARVVGEAVKERLMKKAKKRNK